jgi:hypothetical protein
MVFSSGARRCPRLFFTGAMHAMAGESKTMLPRDHPSSAIDLLLMVRQQGVPFWSSCSSEVSSFGRDAVV